jgi:hypothetical protein
MSAGRKDPKGAEAPTEGAPIDPVGMIWQQVEKSWTASFDMWSAWAGTWQSIVQNRGAPAVKAMVDQLANPAAWPGGLAPLTKELEDILALPRFADLPGLDAGTLPSFAPALELMAVAQQYLMAAAPVWASACQRFQAVIAERRGAMDSAGEVMDIWNNVLDETLMAFNRSAEFGSVQQRFLRAAMRQRQEVRKLAERAAQAVDLPTRTEMDDVYHRLHDLLREVHGLRRELRALKRSRADDARPVPAEAGRS